MLAYLILELSNISVVWGPKYERLIQSEESEIPWGIVLNIFVSLKYIYANMKMATKDLLQ